MINLRAIRGSSAGTNGHRNQATGTIRAIMISRLAMRRRCNHHPHSAQAGAFTVNGLPNIHNNHVHQPIAPVIRRTVEPGSEHPHTTHLSGKRALCFFGRFTSVLNGMFFDWPHRQGAERPGPPPQAHLIWRAVPPGLRDCQATGSSALSAPKSKRTRTRSRARSEPANIPLEQGLACASSRVLSANVGLPLRRTIPG